MAGAGFKMDMKAMQKFMDGFQKRVSTPSPLMVDIGEALVASTKERLIDGINPEGKAQPAVKRGGTPLVDSGDYKDRITYAAGADHVTIGTNHIQAATLHFGDERKPKNKKALKFTPAGSNKELIVKKVTIPARPHFGISEDDKDEIAHTVGIYLRGEQK